MSEKTNKALASLLDFLQTAKNYDKEEGSAAKFELLESAKTVASSLDDVSGEVLRLTDAQKDQIGMNFYEKLFKILE